jgi:hypothetical protein
MASKDSVRFLSNSVAGLGDRIRQGTQMDLANKRSDEALSLQKRSMASQEQKMNFEQNQFKRAKAEQIFEKNVNDLAEVMAAKNKTSAAQERVNATQQVYSMLDEPSKAILKDYVVGTGVGSVAKRDIAGPPGFMANEPQPSNIEKIGSEMYHGLNPVGLAMRSVVEPAKWLMQESGQGFPLKKMLLGNRRKLGQ